MRAPLLILIAAIVLSGCRRAEPAAATSPHVLETIAHAQAPNNNAGLTSEKHLDGAPRVTVAGYPTVPPFSVLQRTKVMQQFPCQKCHTKTLDVLRAQSQVQVAQGKKASHWNVKMVHAPAVTMDCWTCHEQKNLESLRTLRDAPISLDHAYQVCAQCHSRQAADWAGGAHGKRQGGWAPPRVVASCVGCHNPHKPKLELRWPALAGRRDLRFESPEPLSESTGANR